MELKRYISKDDQTKLFSCSFPVKDSLEPCGHTSRHLQNIKMHIKAHLKLKPFDCKQCDRSFLTLQNLNDHSRRHDGVR